MNSELPKLCCPLCNNPISVNKEWVIKCNKCEKELSIIRHNGEIVSVRQTLYHPNYYIQNDLFRTITDLVNKNLPLEKWGFSKNIRFPNNTHKGTVIYDSEFCRVKFVLESSDYFPQHDTKIYYGRLHAPDNEHTMIWNGKPCSCWHRGISTVTVPFIEGIPPQQLIENPEEIFYSLVGKLNLDYPSFDMVEYPLRLHSKIWEYYKEKFFSIFDLRNPKLWEEYIKYLGEYDEAFYKKYNISLDRERVC